MRCSSSSATRRSRAWTKPGVAADAASASQADPGDRGAGDALARQARERSARPPRPGARSRASGPRRRRRARRRPRRPPPARGGSGRRRRTSARRGRLRVERGAVGAQHEAGLLGVGGTGDEGERHGSHRVAHRPAAQAATARFACSVAAATVMPRARRTGAPAWHDPPAVHHMRVLRPADGIVAFYDGRVEGRFAEAHLVDDGALARHRPGSAARYVNDRAEHRSGRARAHRLQPVDAVRGVPALHGGRRGGPPARRHAPALAARRSAAASRSSTPRSPSSAPTSASPGRARRAARARRRRDLPPRRRRRRRASCCSWTPSPRASVEKVGDALGVLKRRVKGDLERFKELIEARGTESRRLARRGATRAPRAERATLPGCATFPSAARASGSARH